MIQLGSILAVMWLYRRKILDIVGGLPLDAGGEAVCPARCSSAFVPVASLAGACSGGLRQDGALSQPRRDCRVVRHRRASSCWSSSASAQRRRCGRVDETPVWQGAWHRRVSDAGARSGRLAIGRHDCRRAWCMGFDRRVAAEFSFFLAMPTMTAAFANDLLDVRGHLTPDRALEIARRLRDGVRRLAARSSSRSWRWSAASGFAPFAWYRIVVGLAIPGAIAAGIVLNAVAAPQLHRRVLRHGAAVHQRHGARLALRHRRRPDCGRCPSGSWAGTFPGLGDRDTAAGIVLVGALATNVIGRRVLQRGERYLLRGAGLPDHLCPGEAACCRLFTGQRVRLQARRPARRQAGIRSRLPDEGIHGRSGEGAGGTCGGLRPH